VEYRGGADPALEMVTAEGIKEVVKIDAWKRDHIIEFLKEKL